MKTYVEIENCTKKFATIDDAVKEAERRRLETCEIFVFNAKTGEILETQKASRNSYNGDLAYSTWGVFYTHLDDDGKIAWSGILEDEDSEAEALEVAQQIGGSNIYIQAYTQTLSEYIETIGEPKFVNGKEGVQMSDDKRLYPDDFVAQLLANEIEQFMFERGEYDLHLEDRIRWLKTDDRKGNAKYIRDEILKDNIGFLTEYLTSEISSMSEDDELIPKAEKLIEELKGVIL